MKPLHIVVCLKSVPDPARAAAIALDDRTLTLRKQGVPRVISPLDRTALEEALRIRECRDGTVRVVSMGSPGATENLREALALGADEAILLSDPLCAGADTLATARALASIIRWSGPFDLILCGARSFYGSTGQVGPQLAVLLDLPHVSRAAAIALPPADTLRVKSRVAAGYALVEIALPALVSVVKEINVPRGISLPGIVAARAKPLRTLSCSEVGLAADEVGLAGSATRIVGICSPTMARQVLILGGDAREAVDGLIGHLRQTGGLANLLAGRSAALDFAAPPTVAPPVSAEPRPVPAPPSIPPHTATAAQRTTAGSMASHTEARDEVWVFAEQRDGVLLEVGLEILAEARRLADILATKVCAILLGCGIAAAANELILRGADRVFFADDVALARCDPDPFAATLIALARTHRPQILLLGATPRGRDLAAAVAARLGTGLCADCTAFDVDGHGRLLQIAPVLGGKQLATMLCPERRPQMATVRPGVFLKRPRTERTGQVTSIGPTVDHAHPRYKVQEEVMEIAAGQSLGAAEIVVAGGAGIAGGEGWQLIQRLAEVLHAAVGGTRPPMDDGYLAEDQMIGQSGVTIRPKLYIAIGISGDIQHTVGFRDAGTVVAINNDPAAPIFKVADYGIVGDYREVVPSLVEALRG